VVVEAGYGDVGYDRLNKVLEATWAYGWTVFFAWLPLNSDHRCSA